MNLFFKLRMRRGLFGLFGGRGPHGRCGAAPTAEQYAQMRDRVVQKASRKLSLNADQQQRLTQLGDTLIAQRLASQAQTNSPRAQMRALLDGSRFDLSGAQDLVQNAANKLTAQSPEMLTAVGGFFDSLNPVQQQQVRDRLDGRGRWFGCA